LSRRSRYGCHVLFLLEPDGLCGLLLVTAIGTLIVLALLGMINLW